MSNVVISGKGRRYRRRAAQGQATLADLDRLFEDGYRRPPTFRNPARGHPLAYDIVRLKGHKCSARRRRAGGVLPPVDERPAV